MTTTHPTQPEPEDQDDLLFHDSYDRLLSSTTCSSSSSCSEIEDNNNNNIDDVTTGDYYNYNSLAVIPKFPIGVVNNYDVWISSPSSVDERRLRLLRRMGLGRDSAFSRRKTSFSSIIRSKSADHDVSNKKCDVSSTNLEIVPVADSLVSVSNVRDSDEVEFATIRNLDNGKEFVVDEVREDGMCGNVKEVETGRRLTMEEFEMGVGRSPIVQELMRRENVEAAACGGNEGLRGEDSGNGNGNGNGSRVKKKSGWFKSIKNVASSVAGFKERRSSDERDTSSERGARRSSSATDDSQDVAFHGPERVRVRQYGKSCKDLSALYKSQEIHAHNGTIWTIKFSLDGKYLASAGEDRLIHIWQVGSSDRKGDLLFDKQEDVNLNVLLLSNGSPELGLGSPKLDMIPEKKRRGRLSISRKSTSLDHIRVPETIFALSEKPVCSFIGHEADVLDLSWSKSQHLLSSSMDKTVRLWDLSSQSCLKIFSHNDFVTCIQFNPVDDRYFISGSLDAKVRIWSIPDHQVVDWNDMREMVTAACYTPDGQAALVGSYKGSCCLYNTTENKLQEKSRINLQNKKKSRHKKITGFQFAPGTASEVLITSADSRIRVVDGADLVHKFKGNTYQIFSLHHILFN
ncbi:transducin/WD40 repeat-like superfamily protein [Artemisia annua]|uniref:Transducin/WD40 repeat-like superfamily protein n=1 Tax=Artemisia annua TaxID=35608 RepID=A0A2U1PNJ4_ARTAN|nr:transducin/WD40 repeat-like superfamily protein [Artemisia annua]